MYIYIFKIHILINYNMTEHSKFGEKFYLIIKTEMLTTFPQRLQKLNL